MKINITLISLIFLISCHESQKINWCKEGKKKAQEEIKQDGLKFIKFLTLSGGSDRYAPSFGSSLGRCRRFERCNGI